MEIALRQTPTQSYLSYIRQIPLPQQAVIAPGRVKARSTNNGIASTNNGRASTSNGRASTNNGRATNQFNLQLRIQPPRAAKLKSSEDHIQKEIDAFTKKYADIHGKQQGHVCMLDEMSKCTKQIELPRPVWSPCSPDIGREDAMDISDEVKKPFDREAVIQTKMAEYEADIYDYQRSAELRNRASAGFMNIQNDFTWSTRCIMVDWMVDVSQEFELHTETLFLAVNYVDRFLSKIPVSRRQIQLVGAASLFLASKYEEIRSRRCDVDDLASMTIGYTAEQVLCMERFILRVLKFNVTVPTTSMFGKDFVKSCDGDDKLKALSKFLCELTLIEMDTYLKYRPSITAAASLCLARFSLGLEPWTAGLAKKSGYEMGHLEDCLKDLRKTYCGAEAHPQQAVQEKYKQDKYHRVSDFNMNPVPNNVSCQVTER